MQSILDYTRSPSTTSSAAIDPVFNTTSIIDESSETNYPFYWTGTTHANWTETPGQWAVYVAFGEALGWMEQPPPGSGDYVLQDVHGAGAQRSDPKEGNPAVWPNGNGPQGDVVRILNYVRAVRGGTTTPIGGMAELPDVEALPEGRVGSPGGSSSVLYAALAVGLGGAAVLVAAGGLYARRRSRG